MTSLPGLSLSFLSFLFTSSVIGVKTSSCEPSSAPKPVGTMFDGQRATMAPNADPRLGSYQRCSEHSLSAVGRGVDGDDDDDDNGIVDVGTGLDVDNSMLSTGSASFVVVEMVHRRLCRRPPASLVVGIALSLLSVGAGWLASDAHSAARRRHAAGRVADAKAEVEIDGIDVPSLIWSDEFEGDEVDPTKWSFANGDGCDVGLCGWGERKKNAHEMCAALVPNSPPSILRASPFSISVFTRRKPRARVVHPVERPRLGRDSRHRGEEVRDARRPLAELHVEQDRLPRQGRLRGRRRFGRRRRRIEDQVQAVRGAAEAAVGQGHLARVLDAPDLRHLRRLAEGE